MSYEGFQPGDICRCSHTGDTEFELIHHIGQRAWAVKVIKQGAGPYRLGSECYADIAYLTVIRRPSATPAADPPDVASLRAIHEGRGYSVPYARLETLICAGYVNATGVRLTEKGIACLP